MNYYIITLFMTFTVFKKIIWTDQSEINVTKLNLT